MKKAQSQVWWVLAIIIIILVSFIIWLTFTGKIGSFIWGFELP